MFQMTIGACASIQESLFRYLNARGVDNPNSSVTHGYVLEFFGLATHLLFGGESLEQEHIGKYVQFDIEKMLVTITNPNIVFRMVAGCYNASFINPGEILQDLKFEWNELIATEVP